VRIIFGQISKAAENGTKVVVIGNLGADRIQKGLTNVCDRFVYGG
jgi:hypothetical protein